MAATSTLPQVRERLTEVLAAALPEVSVTASHPGDTLPDEAVFLGEAIAESTIPTFKAGRKRRQESYRLDVWVDVLRGGQVVTDAELRAFELFAAVEDSLADDPTLGLSSLLWAYVVDWDERVAWDGSRRGWACLLRISVKVEARLS